MALAQHLRAAGPFVSKQLSYRELAWVRTPERVCGAAASRLPLTNALPCVYPTEFFVGAHWFPPCRGGSAGPSLRVAGLCLRVAGCAFVLRDALASTRVEPRTKEANMRAHFLLLNQQEQWKYMLGCVHIRGKLWWRLAATHTSNFHVLVQQYMVMKVVLS